MNYIAEVSTNIHYIKIVVLNGEFFLELKSEISVELAHVVLMENSTIEFRKGFFLFSASVHIVVENEDTIHIYLFFSFLII